MNYDVVFGTAFRKSIKRLKKRFPSVKKDAGLAIEILLGNPKVGVLIPEGPGVRKLIAGYFSKKLKAEAEKVWDEKGLSDENMDQWLKELS
ncbi:MAG: hypothetical protein GY749_15510 [Desulfobacteraceae bacterium]|nr:hypothetical protein [Desulfobacteraceae bacterium]